MRPEMRLTPPRRARRRMAGLVMPWMLSRSTLRWRFAPPLPRPLPPFPRPDMSACVGLVPLSPAEGQFPWDSSAGEGQTPAAARCKPPRGTSRPLARPRSMAALAALLVRPPGGLALADGRAPLVAPSGSDRAAAGLADSSPQAQSRGTASVHRALRSDWRTGGQSGATTSSGPALALPQRLETHTRPPPVDRLPKRRRGGGVSQAAAAPPTLDLLAQKSRSSQRFWCNAASLATSLTHPPAPTRP
mmetsp:Transcript_4654/g.15514  ORF Transcript_4654/g.15514 Transcript_4654/m.15514 type:complete len:246 (+) Transcript_4654:442-1179(+)